MKYIDLNCDMGEVPDAVADGSQEALMPFLSSINVACGAHAGDRQTMTATVTQALRWNLAIGAHPGYPDRANFGRIELNLPLETITDSVFSQLQTLAQITAECGARLTHVKPHGALYNQAARDPAVAEAIAAGILQWGGKATLIGLAGSVMLDVFAKAGFAVAAEAFADRRYEPDGTLRSRKLEASLISDPQQAARQALSIVQQGRAMTLDGKEVSINAQTLCIHGDNPNALAIAAAVRKTLKQEEIAIQPLT